MNKKLGTVTILNRAVAEKKATFGGTSLNQFYFGPDRHKFIIGKWLNVKF